MKKFNQYYKPSHNGKSKIYHKPFQRKKSEYKINKQVNRQIEIKGKKPQDSNLILYDDKVKESFLTPNGWIIADFITPKNYNTWYLLESKFSEYVNFLNT
ncbi:hypothetical protein QJ854_gp943 [Moumouvirus goulette]|uniref:Uncharacterized protein n=1 Tax=Moumouvirus goulette TaxID=1247379 RepID=M1PAE6_9VIRU|nr:hypothetical protein QJ854_gp943 [Moumouvirus goulette]AGF84839.1 hypothetical protein glt_00030 [Moumouvirus goulette]